MSDCFDVSAHISGVGEAGLFSEAIGNVAINFRRKLARHGAVSGTDRHRSLRQPAAGVSWAPDTEHCELFRSACSSPLSRLIKYNKFGAPEKKFEWQPGSDSGDKTSRYFVA